jgi:hypothetical protein
MAHRRSRTAAVEIDRGLLAALRELHPGRTDREILERLANAFLLRRCVHAAQERSTLDEQGAERIAYAELAAMRRERVEAKPDPMLEALAAAPLDDEPTSEEEDRTAREAIAAYERGEAISADELKREMGID